MDWRKLFSSQSTPGPVNSGAVEELLSELSALERRAAEAALEGESDEIAGAFSEAQALVSRMDRAWSGSWLGYHACVYIANFEARTPSDFFDVDQGLSERWRGGSRGNWVIVDGPEILTRVLEDSALKSAIARADKAVDMFNSIKDDALVIANAILSVASDKTAIQQHRDNIAEIEPGILARDYIDHIVGKRTYRTHDTRAYLEGAKVPPHKSIEARIVEAKSKWKSLTELGRTISLLRKYLERRAHFDKTGLASAFGAMGADSMPATPGAVNVGGNVTIISDSPRSQAMTGRFQATQNSQIRQGDTSSAPHITREEFEGDVAEILGLLIDAKEELEANYEDIRRALRRLNQVEMSNSAAVSDLQNKFSAMLTDQEKGALRKLSETTSSIATNIVSSGVWTYVIEPVIKAI